MLILFLIAIALGCVFTLIQALNCSPTTILTTTSKQLMRKMEELCPSTAKLNHTHGTLNAPASAELKGQQVFALAQKTQRSTYDTDMDWRTQKPMTTVKIFSTQRAFMFAKTSFSLDMWHSRA